MSFDSRNRPIPQGRNEPTQSGLQHSIATLAANGWSQRRIAGELGIHRETVARYLRPELPKPAIPPAGSEAEHFSKPAILPAGSLAVADPKPAIVPTGSKAGRTSQCAPLAGVVEQGLLAGFSAQRIYQDLVADHGFTGAYDAVKRFVRRLGQRTEPPFRRVESAPGQELQVALRVERSFAFILMRFATLETITE